MKAFIFVLMTLVIGACAATPARHPLEEGGNLGDFKRENNGPDRYHAGFFDTGSTRN